jgi:FMN reductase [NAD(P)H]
MNETIRTLHAHRSIRSYTDEPVSDDMLDAIVEAAHRGPTSMNAQEISLVVVRNPEKRKRISEIANGQAWIAQAPVFIAVVIDFLKTELGLRKAGLTQVAHESMEGFGVAAVDAGIALDRMMAAAQSLGLGIVPIGGIRRNPQGMVELLELPPLTFPLVGMCIGHIANDVPQKPRIDIKAFRHDERYDAGGYPAAIDAYDQTIMEYWQQLGRADGQPWSSNLAPLQRVYYPQVKPVAAMQRLLNDK